MTVAPPWVVEAAQRAIGASFQDIMSAMGPDALGLDISPETLPDISELALSRLNDDQDKFIVENPYTGGRWKGGKAVIEYARDLSYAMISIYDKNGHRQRIYSVTARPPAPSPEQAPPDETLAQREAEQMSPDDRHVLVYTSNESEYSPGSGEVARLPRPSSVSTVEEVAAPTTPESTPTKPSAQTRVSQASAARTTPVSKSVSVAKAESESVATPTSGFVWDDDKQAYVPAGGAAASAAESESTSSTPSSPHHRRRHKHPPAPTEATQVAMVPPPAGGGVVWDDNKQTYVPAGGGSSETSSAAAPVKATEVAMTPKANSMPAAAPGSASLKEDSVPSTEELLGTASPVLSASSSQPPPHPKAVPAADQALIAQASKEAAQEEASNTGPDTSASDQWVPKPMKAPKVREEPVQVAMAPAASPVTKPYDSTVANVTPLSPQAAAAESDAWVPRKTVLAPADADIRKELSQLKSQRPAEHKPVVKINHDINNPEAGVLPVNSFEKFSGPRYGRHREYERRLYFGKKPKSPVQGYDFYVDEVDRKKEIHNVYYYRKGKVPKLVAVEKHDRVTFMENYDVDKEDKGKISEE